MAPPATYDISILFRSAENLPIADLGSISSDPYVAATLHTRFSDRDRDNNPPLRFRTPTIRTTTEPTWECRWDVSNVPKLSTRLRVEVLDEDYRDNDDKLGHVVIDFATLLNWGEGEGEGAVMNENWYKLKKKGASKKAAVLRLCVAGAKKSEGRTARILVRVEVKGETKLEKEKNVGRAFTSGPNSWSKHFSPIIGKVIGAKNPDNSSAKADVFSFEANKLQLTGPVPPKLRHKYVSFAPFVTAYFTRSGLRGRVLNHALHSQYDHLYCHDQSTEYGCIDNTLEGEDSNALAKQFLGMVHWGGGYRMFTYVITLDSEWHFTETGDEFAIDLLSKHSLHSDVSRVIAYSGEFFVRRKYHHHQNSHNAPEASMENGEKQKGEHEARDHADAITLEPSPKHSTLDHNPAHYELVIDNDSGTYRPDKELLPQLKLFLEFNLRGIGEVITYDCLDETLQKLKHDRKEAKQHGGRRVFRQRSISSNGSISSSDEEELDTGREGNVFKRLRGKWMMSGGGGGR